MAAAAGTAAAEEGMEPRALQYEQTLVSEASRALRSAPGPLLLVTRGSARTGTGAGGGRYPNPAAAL